jgi:ankyrin repeat protein
MEHVAADQLFRACVSGDEAVCLAWLAQGGDPNQLSSELRTPLAWAADCGHEHLVKLLVAHGADATVADAQGELPLHRACLGGHLSCVSRLLERDEEAAEVASASGMLPLHCAALEQSSAVVERLCGLKKLSPNRRDAEGFSALHYAASHGAAAVVRVLCGDPRVDVDKCDRDEGSTALMHAAREGHEEVVRVLLAGGASLEARNDYGFTAFDYAEAPNVIDLLSNCVELFMECECTKPGETLLFMWRDWTTDTAVVLRTSELLFPMWRGVATDVTACEEFKLAISDGHSLRWEAGDNWKGNPIERRWRQRFRA